MLEGKTVVLGVTGSIASYKIASLASMLVKLKADVHVIMTQNATEFINPITFETLTGNKCLVDTFDRNFQFHVTHVSLGQKADVIMVAPASANIIGKLAHGIADDMLSTTLMATTAPIIVSPAMNVHMYENPILQDNLKKLKAYGIQVIDPAVGYLACGDIGAGKMPEHDTLLEYILMNIACPKDLQGRKVLITAGPTQEALDPVRFLTNHSTGKMGYALARVAALRGASVTLISGPVNLKPPMFCHCVSVTTADQMYDEVLKRQSESDIIIMAAAVADYRPEKMEQEKIKKHSQDSSLCLTRTKDILKELGQSKREHQILCGFSMETEDMIQNSRKKMKDKKTDFMIANNLKEQGAGFGTDTNVVTILTSTGEEVLPILPKEQVAQIILDRILKACVSLDK